MSTDVMTPRTGASALPLVFFGLLLAGPLAARAQAPADDPPDALVDAEEAAEQAPLAEDEDSAEGETGAEDAPSSPGESGDTPDASVATPPGTDVTPAEEPAAACEFPADEEWDRSVVWVRLTSGEVAGGEIDSLTDGKLKLKSPHMGDQEILWEEVLELYSQAPMPIVLVDGTIHVGGLTMCDGSNITVHSDDGDLALLKSDIAGLNQPEITELSHWYFKVSAGLNFADATNDSLAAATLVRISRRDDSTRLSLNHDFSYGLATDAAGVETLGAHNQWGLAKFDYFPTDVFYLTLASFRTGYDILQNIGFRATPAAGVGLHILDGGPELDFEISGLYQYTRFDSVMAGADEDSSGGGGGYRLYFEWAAVPDRFGLIFEHSGNIVYSEVTGLGEFAQSNFRTTLTLDFDLVSIFTLDITGTHDRVVEAQPLADGSSPQPDTWTLMASLGFEYGKAE